MHVLYCLNTGGIEVGAARLISGLDREQFEHVVCTVLGTSANSVAIDAPQISLGRAPGKASFLLPDLIRIFRRERPDVVHSRGWGTIEAVFGAKIAGVPRILHVEHGLDVAQLKGEPWRRRIARRFAYGMADKVATVSRDLAAKYARLSGVPLSRFDIVLDGIDTRRFAFDDAARAKCRAAIGAGEDRFVLGCVARLDPVKNHLLLLRALQLFCKLDRAVTLVLAGDGPERPRLEAEVANLGLQDCVRFLGNLKDVRPWLSAFDACVLPSLFEGISVSLLESMACGLPVIASDVGGNGEVIEPGVSGLLFPSNDVSRLAASITQVQGDAALRKTLGKNARHRTETVFSLPAMLARYAKLYTGESSPTCQSVMVAGAQSQ